MCTWDIKRFKTFFRLFLATHSQERWLHPWRANEQTRKNKGKEKEEKWNDRRINRRGEKKVPSWKSSNLLQLIMRQASNSGSNESISHQRSHTKWLPLDIIFYHFARLVYRLLKLSFPSPPLIYKGNVLDALDCILVVPGRLQERWESINK